jgi:hypothetical protein
MEPELAQRNVRLGWALVALFLALVAGFVGVALLFQ